MQDHLIAFSLISGVVRHRLAYLRRFWPVLGIVCCVALTGCGGLVVRPSAQSSGPNLSINANSLSFGNVALNSTSTQAIVLTSSGSVPVQINSPTLNGSVFTISGLSFPTTLSPGQQATLYVQFAPTTAGPVTGQLTVSSNSVLSPTMQVGLSGAGGAGSSTQGYQVNLTWSAPDGSNDPIVGYEVYRSSSGSTPYQLINSSLDAQTSFTDSAVQSGSTYEYYVTTVDAEGAQSVPSNIAEVTVP